MGGTETKGSRAGARDLFSPVRLMGWGCEEQPGLGSIFTTLACVLPIGSPCCPGVCPARRLPVFQQDSMGSGWLTGIL